MRALLVVLLLALAAACGPQGAQDPGASAGAQEEVQVDPAQATAQAEQVVGDVLDAVAPGRAPTPSPGSGELGPPCDPDGPVTRSRFVGAHVDLAEDDDVAQVVRAAERAFTDAGLEVEEVRTEQPQPGAHARDGDGGTYSLRVLVDAGRIAAGANTPCLPDADAGGSPTEDGADIETGADTEDAALADLVEELAAAAADGAPVGTVPADCPGGEAAQRRVDLGDADEAAAAFERLVEALGSAAERTTEPDGSWWVTAERDGVVVAGFLQPEETWVGVVAERGCEEA